MNDLQGLRVVVAGAGAVGSVTALSLIRRGVRVVLADPGSPGDNASGVAAGMLAPVFEALLDPLCADHYLILKAARDAWTPLLQAEPGLPPLDLAGALLQVSEPDVGEALLARASALGALLEAIGAADARARAPGLAGQGTFLFTPDDWRLDPRAMLAALHAAFEAAGGLRLAASASRWRDGWVLFEDAEPLAADALVLATGAAGGGLTPIKGQILRFDGFGPATGPVVRGEGVYAAPSGQGMIVGATMEEGRLDRAIDPQAVARLRAGAARLYPGLGEVAASASAGVRAATADGLPLVGPTDDTGVFAARGARRNGWLLAPLMAEVIAERLAGAPLSAAASAFDPARFG